MSTTYANNVYHTYHLKYSEYSSCQLYMCVDESIIDDEIKI